MNRSPGSNKAVRIDWQRKAFLMTRAAECAATRSPNGNRRSRKRSKRSSRHCVKRVCFPLISAIGTKSSGSSAFCCVYLALLTTRPYSNIYAAFLTRTRGEEFAPWMRSLHIGLRRDSSQVETRNIHSEMPRPNGPIQRRRTFSPSRKFADIERWRTASAWEQGESLRRFGEGHDE